MEEESGVSKPAVETQTNKKDGAEHIRAAKRLVAWWQYYQKEIDRIIPGRRILVNYTIFLIFLTDND